VAARFPPDPRMALSRERATAASRRDAVLLVAHELGDAQAYHQLASRLKGSGAWWCHLDGSWLVVTHMSPRELRDEVATYTGADDKVLVVDVTDRTWSALGLSDPGSAWLQWHL
jgi:hypothetical protein